MTQDKGCRLTDRDHNISNASF